MTTPEVWGHVRLPAVAGGFYPAQASPLHEAVAECLRRGRAGEGKPPKAVIAPHAGYAYSGPIAGSAFAALARNGAAKRVVLIGPSHQSEFDGLALSEAIGFGTPLGVVPVDEQAGQLLKELPQVQRLEEPHVPEHCLEVELPFLQQIIPFFKIVPLLIGSALDEEVAQVIELLWGGPETAFVISSDLSHYLSYEEARELDELTAQAIEALEPERIRHSQACGSIGIRGWLRVASQRGLTAQRLDLRNSGDTAGRRDRVVGYGAFSFQEK